MRVCMGVYPRGILTGRRSMGEPLVRPVKASPSHCPSRRAVDPLRSVRFGPPAARSGSSPRLRGAGRTSESLATTPSSTRQPVKACPSETLRLVIISPIRKIVSVSNFRARELPFAPGSWPLSTPSGLGLSHARGRKPVEDRPLTVLRRVLSRVDLCLSAELSLSLLTYCEVRETRAGDENG